MGLVFTVRESPGNKWEVVNAEGEVQAEFNQLSKAEEHVIIRAMASFFTHAIQDAFSSDEGEELWESLLEFLGPHDTELVDQCPICADIILDLIPESASLMASTFTRALEVKAH